MFATRILARAPAANRLVTSSSTLRMASMSAFTSGSKLRAYFGKAIGETSGLAFRSSGLRMSLSRAFSSKPPISEPTEADLLAAARSYTVETLKKDFPTLVARMEAMFQPAPETEPRIISPDSVLALLTILHTMSYQRYLLMDKLQLPFRAQFIDNNLPAYSHCVHYVASLTSILKKEGTEEICSYYRFPLDDFLATERHYYSSSQEFQENHQAVLQGFPQSKEVCQYHQENQTLDALELMFQLSDEINETFKGQSLDPDLKIVMISDQIWLKYRMIPQDLGIDPELLSPEGKERFAAIHKKYVADRQ